MPCPTAAVGSVAAMEAGSGPAAGDRFDGSGASASGDRFDGTGASASGDRLDVGVVRRRPFGANPLVGAKGTDTRRRILASALEVFGQVSFAEARVEQIADGAGCSRPAFYQYFESKDDVFWELASALGAEMVALADRLGPVTPDAAGVDVLADWIRDFMVLHDAWSPVFEAYPDASRGRPARATESGDVGERMGAALLGAFGLSRSQAHRRLVRTLVMVLIRCSFYAEHTPASLSNEPLVRGLARLFHRVLARPIEGVNLRRHDPTRPARRIRIEAPGELEAPPQLNARGAATRRRLLDAGAQVLPERGYHDARVDDIVEAAGVSHGTFYRYFDSKDDFFRALATEASTRMIELLDRLSLDAPPDELRAWLDEWFDAYEADGGIISTWQDMRTSPELGAFSQQVAVGAFTRLERILEERDFGDGPVATAMLLALVERVPYGVFSLGFATRKQAIDATVTIIRRGFLALDEG